MAAKRKRGIHDDDKEDLGLFLRVGKIGLPEVDKIMESQYFKKLVPKRRKLVPLHKDKNDDLEDRISKLPDSILQFIISFLTTREGAATCILSRQWRNLWSESVSRLDFTDFNVFGCQFTENILEVKQKELLNNMRHNRRSRIKRSLQLRCFKIKGFLENQRAQFIKRVNQTLKLRRASKMNEFLVSFPLGNESISHVDGWMKLAAAQGVRKLELDFNWSHFSLSYDFSMFYVFPAQEFGSSLNYLRLRFCTIKFPPDFQGLNSLVSLSLTQSYLTDDNVQAILSNCPSLEFLSLSDFYAPDPTTLKFVGPSTSLKHLDIRNCRGVYEIELQDVNLLSFELRLPHIPQGFISFDPRLLKLTLSIKNAPLLARLALHVDPLGPFRGSVETLSNVPHLETLFIKNELSKLPKLSAFNNLKRLVFSAKYDKSNLFEVLCFLEACPLLEQLHVDMGISSVWDSELTERSSKITTTPECPHNNLKEVEIYEFNAHSEQIELAKYLLKNAMGLEKMKICTTCKTYRAQGVWRLSKRTAKPLRMSLDEVRELLLKEKHDCTKLLIVST